MLADIIIRGSMLSMPSRLADFRADNLRFRRALLRPANTFPKMLSKKATIDLLHEMFLVNWNSLIVTCTQKASGCYRDVCQNALEANRSTP
jgi:hypothetical protein